MNRKGPYFALTKEQHDAEVERLGRPITQNGIRFHHSLRADGTVRPHGETYDDVDPNWKAA